MNQPFPSINVQPSFKNRMVRLPLKKGDMQAWLCQRSFITKPLGGLFARQPSIFLKQSAVKIQWLDFP